MPRTSDCLVLIVEHDVYLRWTLRTLFDEAGCMVVCASNGIGGLRRAVELKPVLIVLGAALPELSTCDLFEQLRADHRFSRSQIVTVEEILYQARQPDGAPLHAILTVEDTAEKASFVVAPLTRGRHADALTGTSSVGRTQRGETVV